MLLLVAVSLVTIASVQRWAAVSYPICMSGKPDAEVGAGGMPHTEELAGSRVTGGGLGCGALGPIGCFVTSGPPPSSAFFQSIVKVTVPVLTNLKPLLPPASSASIQLRPACTTDE